MELEKMEGHNPAVAPGMSLVIEAGMVYCLQAEDGELELVGRESAEVLTFLHRFDVWRDLQLHIGDGTPLTEGAWANLLAAWEGLPSRLKSEMPSQIGRGVRL